MYFVYVIQNQASKRLYTGHTQDVEQRLGQHNCGITKSTKNRRRWKLVFYERFATRGEAMRREKFLKSGQGREEISRILTRGSESRSAG